jgi:hypothetical protein
MLDVLDAGEFAVELCIELLDLLTDESLPDWTNEGPTKIFPIYGGRFTDPLKQQDPGSFPSCEIGADRKG